NATLKVKFAPGLHGYQNPPTDKFQIPISVSAGKGTTLSKVSYPKGVMRKAGGDTTESAVYEGEITIKVAIKVPTGAGAHDLNLVLNYQQ
ncbi:protein-disulfide reductase DsbD domain-containing protein, partial [Lactococcus lactis]|uniref:protein-disulfide reductase DsbD domain-containing protein n=1 Tax=Lactococcus lactis TaxID=1358 RepID=UPI003D0AECD2